MNHPETLKQPAANYAKSTSMQDDARSFRSKVGAMKMLIRTQSAYDSIHKFLLDQGRAEYLVCYRDMEEIKLLDDDQMVSRTAALIWRYKTSYDAARLRGHVVDTLEYRIWECFGKLRQLDIANAPAEVVKKYLIIAQNEIIARLALPFDDYLLSPNYKEWQAAQIEAEKVRRAAVVASRQNSRQNSRNNSRDNSFSAEYSASAGHLVIKNGSGVVTGSVSAPISTGFNAADYPDVLIVDDSFLTLKITGKTLTGGGHHVERATNGHIALELMKSRPYDVVLIDCNMPVMDGYEAVRIFREYERQKADPALFKMRRKAGTRRPKKPDDPLLIREEEEGEQECDDEDDDMSSISDSDEEEEEDEEDAPPTPSPHALRTNNKDTIESNLTKPQLSLSLPTMQQNYSRQDVQGNGGNGKEIVQRDPSTMQSQPIELSFATSPDGSVAKQDARAEASVVSHSDNNHGSTPNVPLTAANVASLPNERQMRKTLTNEHYHQLIIGMSTNCDDETRDKAIDAGMDFFLPKPFTLQKFVETLRLSKVKRIAINSSSSTKINQTTFPLDHTDSCTAVESVIGPATGTTAPATLKAEPLFDQ